jgi:hypothetical protein
MKPRRMVGIRAVGGAIYTPALPRGHRAVRALRTET